MAEARCGASFPNMRILLTTNSGSYELDYPAELGQTTELRLDAVKTGTLQAGWPGDEPVTALVGLRRDQDHAFLGGLQVEGTSKVAVEGVFACASSLLQDLR